MPAASKRLNGLAVAGAIVGLLSFVTVCAAVISVPLGLVAVVLSAVALGRRREALRGRGLAAAGLGLGLAGLIFSVPVSHMVQWYGHTMRELQDNRPFRHRDEKHPSDRGRADPSPAGGSASSQLREGQSRVTLTGAERQVPPENALWKPVRKRLESLSQGEKSDRGGTVS